MELEVWPSTASSVLMVHSSTRTTSSVTGGSTLTAPLPRNCILSMMKLLLSVKLLQELLLMRVLVPMKHQLTMLPLMKLPQFTNHLRPDLLTDVETTELDPDQDKYRSNQMLATTRMSKRE